MELEDLMLIFAFKAYALFGGFLLVIGLQLLVIVFSCAYISSLKLKKRTRVFLLLISSCGLLSLSIWTSNYLYLNFKNWYAYELKQVFLKDSSNHQLKSPY